MMRNSVTLEITRDCLYNTRGYSLVSSPNLEEVVDDDVPVAVVLGVGGGGPPVAVEESVPEAQHLGEGVEPRVQEHEVEDEQQHGPRQHHVEYCLDVTLQVHRLRSKLWRTRRKFICPIPRGWTPNKQLCFSKSASFLILPLHSKLYYHICSQVDK